MNEYLQKGIQQLKTKQHNMKKIIVTTTINPPTDALLKYAKLEGWTVIVAGDLKTNS
jgi:hypothetical protein